MNELGELFMDIATYRVSSQAGKWRIVLMIRMVIVAGRVAAGSISKEAGVALVKGLGVEDAENQLALWMGLVAELMPVADAAGREKENGE